MSKKKLELTWIGKEKYSKLKPRILLEDPDKSYHAKHRMSAGDIFDNRLIFGDNLLALKAFEQEFIIMAETKKHDDLASAEVKAKAGAAARWCPHAAGHEMSAASRGSTSWCRTMRSRSRKNYPAIFASRRRFEQRKECRR